MVQNLRWNQNDKKMLKIQNREKHKIQTFPPWKIFYFPLSKVNI
jgi:hypothetical protein